MPTVGSLFSGIGGLDLGLERAGWTVRWQVERDEWCQQVLAKHWPDTRRFGDIKAFLADTEREPVRVRAGGVAGTQGADQGEGNQRQRVRPDAGDGCPERVDLIAGGFPCQPVSLAGRRRGTDDERWLWPEFCRVVRLLRPRYVLVENVPGLLVPFVDGDGEWNSAPVEEVLGDLAALGYMGEWTCIPAAAVGAPHLRWRVFIVAYAERDGSQRVVEAGAAPRAVVGSRDVPDTDERRLESIGFSGLFDGERSAQRYDSDGCGRAIPDDDGERRDGRSGVFGSRRWGELTEGCRWEPESGFRRVAHGVPARVDRLRGLGNAVVPQVAEAVGRMILQHMGSC